MNDIKTNKSDWNSIYSTFANIENISGLGEFRNAAEEAAIVINTTGGIGRCDFSITSGELVKFISTKTKLINFAKEIHGEYVEKIDTPFFQQMQGFTKVLYSLRPEEEDVESDNGEWYETLRSISLKGLVNLPLRNSYLELWDEVNDGEPSDRLNEVMDEGLWQWRDEMTFEDMKAIDRTLIKADNSTADLYYEMSPHLVIKQNDYVVEDPEKEAAAFYTRKSSGIYLNMDEQGTSKFGAYNAFFHEMGHMIDNSIVEIINDKNVSENSDVFASSSYSKYSDEFYSNLKDDVWSYGDKYNPITRYWDVKKDLGGEENAEASDIFSGVSNGLFGGKYGHDYDYWDYTLYFLGSASKEPLNQEAFAHFMQMSITKSPEDIKTFETMFPNAYKSYEKIIDEMNQELNNSKK